MGKNDVAGHEGNEGRGTVGEKERNRQCAAPRHSCNTLAMPASLTIRDEFLPYVERLQLRAPADIDLAVIHCTELPDLATAREYGERIVHASGTGNSGHYYIDRDGSVVRYVPEERMAHHVRGRNEHSVGIELVNSGRWPD